MEEIERVAKLANADAFIQVCTRTHCKIALASITRAHFFFDFGCRCCVRKCPKNTKPMSEREVSSYQGGRNSELLLPVLSCVSPRCVEGFLFIATFCQYDASATCFVLLQIDSRSCFLTRLRQVRTSGTIPSQNVFCVVDLCLTFYVRS